MCEVEEDIAQELLENIINMEDVKHDIQAQNNFKINGQKTLVKVSDTGLTIYKNVLTKKRPLFIGFKQIVQLKSSQYERRIEGLKLGRIIAVSGLFKVGSGGFKDDAGPVSPMQFGFLGSRPDCLTLHYVTEDRNKGILRLKQVSLCHDDHDVIEWWSSVIRTRIPFQTKRPRSLLVFINPFGGKGRGKQLWEDQISEVFRIAGVNCKVIVTERANHALDLLQTMPLNGFDGVISVGGDGMFSEIFNGVLLRTARDIKLDQDDKDTNFSKPDMRVGFIPGGSTDTVAMCLHGTTDPVTAALHIVLGHQLDVDAVSIHSRDKLERFAMTMLSYGYFGDLMKHSERLRWLGKFRYDISGVRTFLAHKSYEGTISYEDTNIPESQLTNQKCGEGCTECNQMDIVKESNGKTQLKSISGRFLAVTSATLTCSCRHTLPGMSPGAHTGDGATDLIIVHDTSYLNYFRYLFRTAFNTSHPFTLPFVEAVRVRNWTFQPDLKEQKYSSWNCDGEIIDEPEIFTRAHKQLVPVFARGVYNPEYVKNVEESKMKVLKVDDVLLSRF